MKSRPRSRAQESDDAAFMARYWISSSSSLPSISKTFPKCGTHTSYVSSMDVERELRVNVKYGEPSDRPVLHLHHLAPGVDHGQGVPIGVNNTDSNSESDADSPDDIGTEQHRFRSPAPRPIGSQLARDISVDLMRMRRKSQYSPRKLSPSRPSTSLTSATLSSMRSSSSRALHTAESSSTQVESMDRFPPSFSRATSRGESVRSPTRAEGASTSMSMVSFFSDYSSSQDTHVAEEAAEDTEGPIVRTSARILKGALRGWRELHSDHVLQKQRIIDQYLGCCAYLKRSPFLQSQLRTFLLTPSSDRLELSGAGISSKDIAAFVCGIAGRGCGLRSERVTSIQDVCSALGDPCIGAMDLSDNGLGGEGVATLVKVMLQADFFRLQPHPHVSHPTPPAIHQALTELNIARNAVGVAGSAGLEALLRAPGCSLVRLEAGANMLGDIGCGNVLRGLSVNSSLTALGLSENCASTGAGMALGAMLERNVTLEEIDLTYNHLRGSGARRVGTGLALNSCLQVLKLQWNGFGDEDVMTEMAKALPLCGVTDLNLAHNRIKLKGAAILASSIECGSKLRSLILDGNLIGQIGARVVFRAVQQAVGFGQEFPTSVSLDSCGTHIVDRAAFDPCETAGSYQLDLKDAYNRSVLAKLIRVNSSGSGSFVPLKVKGKNTNFNATLGGISVRVSDNGSIDAEDWSICTQSGVNLPIVEAKDETGQPIPIQRTWAKLLGRREESVPTVLCCSFNNDRKRATLNDALPPRNFDMLLSAFTDPSVSADKCIEIIETIFGSDVFISMEQMEMLLDHLSQQTEGPRGAGMSRVRVIFIARCFHKLVESERNMELLERLGTIEERKALEKALGSASFEFTPNNPTGYHKLDLGDPAQREICMRLVEIKNEMADREDQLADFYYSGRRAGGRREDPSDAAELERVWRNGKLDGKSFQYSSNWKVPYTGLLEVDFVQITKPLPKDARSSGDFSMREPTFRALLASIDKPDLPGRDRIQILRRYSNTELFTCQQLAALLNLFDQPELRAEVCVIGYARTLDWHGFKNLVLRVGLREVKILHQRIGLVNLWDDVMAVDFYELDLSKSSDRFVMQELLHIAAIEPGDNMVDGTYQGIDYTVPSGWLKEVPRSGVISFYYCREQQVIEKVFDKGAWDNHPSPMHLREDGTPFGSTSWSSFIPSWLQQYCEQSPQGGPSPSVQPRDTVWVRPYKIRRIKMKMMEKFKDARSMFNSLDKDGGGSLDRKELAMGLFALGIWLAPTELQALLSILDQDGGGDIDFAEFDNFWSTCNFD